MATAGACIDSSISFDTSLIALLSAVLTFPSSVLVVGKNLGAVHAIVVDKLEGEAESTCSRVEEVLFMGLIEASEAEVMSRCIRFESAVVVVWTVD